MAEERRSGAKHRRDLVTGAVQTQQALCQLERVLGTCGRDAKNFVPKQLAGFVCSEAIRPEGDER